jgi:hypothetical protein
VSDENHRSTGPEDHSRRGRGEEDPDVIQIAFGNEMEPASGAFGLAGCGSREFGEERSGRLIKDGVDGIEAEGIDMELGLPEEGVLQEKVADGITVGPVEVEGLSPGSAIAISEVGGEISEVIAFGPEVIVDDVQNDREAGRVTGIDQFLEAVRSAIGILHGEWIGAVVAPVAGPGELGHGQQFDGGDAEVTELVEVFDDGFEGASLGERADMQFINDKVAEGQPGPLRVGPWKGGIDDSGGAMHTFGLKA